MVPNEGGVKTQRLGPAGNQRQISKLFSLATAQILPLYPPIDSRSRVFYRQLYNRGNTSIILNKKSPDISTKVLPMSPVYTPIKRGKGQAQRL